MVARAGAWLLSRPETVRAYIVQPKHAAQEGKTTGKGIRVYGPRSSARGLYALKHTHTSRGAGSWGHDPSDDRPQKRRGLCRQVRRRHTERACNTSHPRTGNTSAAPLPHMP